MLHPFLFPAFRPVKLPMVMICVLFQDLRKVTLHVNRMINKN